MLLWVIDTDGDDSAPNREQIFVSWCQADQLAVAV